MDFCEKFKISTQCNLLFNSTGDFEIFTKLKAFIIKENFLYKIERKLKENGFFSKYQLDEKI